MSVKYLSRRTVSGILLAAMPIVSPALMAGIAVTESGCFVLGSPGPSAVSQGQQYQSGDPTYDQFFQQLYDLQVELAKAPDEEKNIRAELASSAKLDEGVSATLLSKKIGKRAEELEAAGTGLKLEIEGLDPGEDPKSSLSVKGKELEGDAKVVMRAVESAALSSLKLTARMRKTKKVIEQLNAQALALEASIKTAFRKGGPSKQAEVKKNLEDAKKLLPLMEARADEVGESARTTAKKLAEAVATDKGQFDAPPPPPEPPPSEEPPEEEKKGDKKKGDKKKPAGDAKPPVDKPTPPPADKPPPSDFEP